VYPPGPRAVVARPALPVTMIFEFSTVCEKRPFLETAQQMNNILKPKKKKKKERQN
jgi:hypothetical protein